MYRPIIGIAPQYMETEKKIALCETYEKAILEEGGLPILLPLHAGIKGLRQALHLCDGYLLPGGPDVSPFLYDEETKEGCGKISLERDKMELRLVREVLSNRSHRKKPLLAICRGIQVLNVAMGGTLYQDMIERPELENFGEKLEHYQKATASVPVHTVLLEERKIKPLISRFMRSDEWLTQKLQAQEIRTNSFHHQCIRTVAPGFCVCGVTKDGVIEAIHKEGHPFCLGVQWHPEDMRKEKIQRELFCKFMEETFL